MDVLQPGEHYARAHLMLVRLRLDALLKNLSRFPTSVRHDFLEIHAHEITHHFPRGDVLQQANRVFVIVNPGRQVGDLELHRHADRQQTGGRRNHVGIGRSLRGRAVGRHEKIIFVLAVVRRAPEHRPAHGGGDDVGIGDETNVDGLDLLGGVAINAVNGPRQFQIARPA